MIIPIFSLSGDIAVTVVGQYFFILWSIPFRLGIGRDL